jgi:hypothetical protein
MRRVSVRAAASAGLLIILAGCGHGEEDRRGAQDPSAHPKGDPESAERLRAEDSRKIEETHRRIHDLRGKLDELQAKIDDAAKTQAQSALAQRNTAASAETIHQEVKTAGPKRCADGSISGKSDRGSCSHHGGIAAEKR